jgi:hypothetical protein
MATWQQQISWSAPHSISQLTAKRGARKEHIPEERGFYAFVEGKHPPSPDRCLYVGIAARQSLYKRLGSYLRKKVTEQKAATMSHKGKRLLSFARIKGVDGAGTATENTERNDKFIHVCWAVSPLYLEGSRAENSLEAAYMLERALVDYYRPIYNTANWERENDFDFEDDTDW